MKYNDIWESRKAQELILTQSLQNYNTKTI